MTLMNFEDGSERVKVREPLFAAAAKLNVPAFGLEKFQLPKTQNLLNKTIKKSLRSPENPIVDLVSLACSDLSQSHLVSDVDKSAAQLLTSNKVYTRREVHDKLHYSTISLGSSRKPSNELLDHFMLRRALDGYLFNCKVNKTVVTDDQWLHDLWEWIQGKFSVIFKSDMHRD